MRIRSYLLLLAALVLVPGFLAATIAVERLRQSEREVALHGLSETARGTALLVDVEIQRSIGAPRYSSGSSGSAPDFLSAASPACFSSKASEMYLMIIHPDLQRVPRIRVVVDMLAALFRADSVA